MTDINQPYPNDAEAERALLGAVMLDPWRYTELAELIDASSWYDPRHATIWESIGSIAIHGGTIDLLSISDALTATGRLDQIGGRAYLTEIIESCPTSVNAGRYAAIIARHAASRAAINIALALQTACFDGGDTATHIDTAMEALSTLQQADSRSGVAFQTMHDLMPGVIDHIQALQTGDESVLGITTGYADLDRLLRFSPGEMIVLAARPSIGKSALMWCMAREQARAEFPVGIFSYEMSSASLAKRAFFMESGVSENQIRDGALSEGAWNGLMEHAGRLARVGIYIDERRGNIMQLRARARRMVRKHGVRCIYIDYLQLIPEQKQSASRNRENAVSVLSAGIKGLAQELNIPVCVLAQLNRDAESDGKRNETIESTRPRLKHLRESGSIEQDADVVMLLHRLRTDPSGKTELLIEKNRNGPTGITPLLWQPDYTRFVAFSRIDDKDVPEGSAEQMRKLRAVEDF